MARTHGVDASARKALRSALSDAPSKAHGHAISKSRHQARSNGLGLRQDRWLKSISIFSVALLLKSIGTANAAGTNFDLKISTQLDKATQGQVEYRSNDPEVCAQDFGWIEEVSRTGTAQVAIDPIGLGDVRIRVRKGNQVEDIAASQFREASDPSADQVASSSTVRVEYVGCVGPSGRVLLDMEAHLNVDLGDGPQPISITYDGPPVSTLEVFETDGLDRFRR